MKNLKNKNKFNRGTIVLYGGEDHDLNKKVDGLLFKKLAKGKVIKKIAYLPPEGDGRGEFFRDFKRNFASKKRQVECFSEKKLKKDEERKKFFQSDIIYLGGGNTFSLLALLRKLNLRKDLLAFVEKGGILCGYSAGAIVLTPSIYTATIPSLEADENEVKLKNRRGLGLTNFEFTPHYLPSCKKSDEELKHYSLKRTPRTLVGCKDGEAIAIKGGRALFLGKKRIFHRGEKTLSKMP